jgi:hypothetical protein
VGGSPHAPAEAACNLIDADLTIKETTQIELAEGGLGVLGQDYVGVSRIGSWAAFATARA